MNKIMLNSFKTKKAIPETGVAFFVSLGEKGGADGSYYVLVVHIFLYCIETRIPCDVTACK
jgi:hypothetical protein